MLVISTHASVSGRRRGPRWPARPPRRGARLGRRRRNARRTAASGLSRGRARFPGIPASGDTRGVRAGAAGAQGGSRVSRLRVPVRPGSDARAGPQPSRPDDQRHRARAGRRPGGPLRRPRRPRGPPAAPRLRRLHRGSGPGAACGPLCGALRAAGFPGGGRDATADARHRRARRSRCARRRARLAGNGQGACDRRSGALLPGAAGLRGAARDLPGDRFAIRRTAACRMASGDRHRRAYAAGARTGDAADERACRALCRAGPRPRQGDHAAGALAAASRPRGTQRGADRRPVGAAAGTERVSRTRADRRPASRQRAPRV